MDATSKKGKLKKKLCWNCEGEVSLEEKNCPFCAVYLWGLEDKGQKKEQEEFLAPPYRFIEAEDEVPSPLYATEDEDCKPDRWVTSYSKKKFKEILIPLGLLSFGLVFFIFSLILYFFSQDGVFTLQWKSRYWFVYFLLSLPMLYLGWKSVDLFEKEELQTQVVEMEEKEE